MVDEDGIWIVEQSQFMLHHNNRSLYAAPCPVLLFSAVIMSGQWPIIVSVTLFSANEMIAVSIVTIQLRTITSGQLSSLPCIATCVCLVSKKLRNLLGARWWNVQKADSAALCLFQCSNAQIGKLDSARHPS